MSNIIEIRSVTTADVKIAQKALETIGFKTVEEGDAIDAYWIKLSVPKPTGKCPNCGGYCYNYDTLCSDKCSEEYIAYINQSRM